MANLNIPNKTTGDTHFAAEYQVVKDFINSPIANLGTYAGATITIDGNGRYARYTMAANMTITFASSGHVEGNVVILPVTADGTDTLTFTSTSAYTIAHDDSLTNGGTLASGNYLFAFAFLAGEIQVTYITQSLIAADVTPPTVVSATVENADPDALVVVFDEIVTITDITGLSLNGDWSGIAITGVTGSGTNTLTFALNTPVAVGESGSFVYGGTNNIIDTSSNVLAAGSTSVTNNVAAIFNPSSLSPQYFNETSQTFTGSNSVNTGIYNTPFTKNFWHVWIDVTVTDGQGSSQVLFGARRSDDSNASRSNSSINPSGSNGVGIGASDLGTSVTVWADGTSQKVIRISRDATTIKMYADGVEIWSDSVTVPTEQLVYPIHWGANNVQGTIGLYLTGSSKGLFIWGGDTDLTAQNLIDLESYFQSL